MPGRRVLCISFDGVVSDSRCTSLRETGYDVAATTSIDEALDLLDRQEFDAVIVGHRFSADEKHLVVAQAKEKGDTPVVLVCGASPESGIPAVSRVYALEGNAGLLSALSRLSDGEAARPQAAA